MAYKQSETCYRIMIRGIVQGVGFRPFVYREAIKYGIRGWVKNSSGSVEILAAGERFEAFAQSVRQNGPPNSFIESMEIEPAAPFEAEGFTVAESDDGENGLRFFSPDLALCDDCKTELFEADTRRTRHFFNTCTVCGPRFSVLKAFPYDRANTSMDIFLMCDDCLAEYRDPGSRRFRAETICCDNCGPALFYRRGDELYKGEDAFAQAVKDLPGGVAVKGIGGYHLACSPYDNEAVRRLRRVKGRESKPFAVMFKDIAAIAEICEVTPVEEDLLQSPARPIVLLKMRRDPFAPGLLNGADGRCGCFLAYTPLQELLLAETPCLIMTSANRSSSPIIKDEPEIFTLTDRVLYHDREIVRSVEDSVVQAAAGKPCFIRRGRGYTPLPVFVNNPKKLSLLAAGGDMKAAFGLLKDEAFTLSQYIGDLEDAQTFGQYESGIADFEKLFAIEPRGIVCDAHPRYFSAKLMEKLAAQRQIPLVKVFHHHGHIASVMAEHRLSRALGVAMDGSGYGEDGHVWGGEFLLCEEGECRRLGHLAYTKLLGADDAARDAAQTAFCYLRGLGLPVEQAGLPQQDRVVMEAALDNNINTFLTSGMGRLFDAVAALLGICRANGYEGECAARLQYAAEREAKAGTAPLRVAFSSETENGQVIFGCRDVLEKCLTGGQGAALGFHVAICDMIEEICVRTREAERVNDVALSGGVFQNTLLLEMVTNRLTGLGFAVYTNEAVPPNDGGLALGQAYIGMRKI